MAAGLGSRLAPLTDRWPKPVLPIDGRPIVVTLVLTIPAVSAHAEESCVNIRQYLSSFTSGASHLEVADAPGDFHTLSDALKGKQLLARPVILSGVSEGAAIAVLAAADRKNHDWIDGVITMGLPPTAELAWGLILSLARRIGGTLLNPEHPAGPISVSIGTAAFPADGTTPVGLLAAADRSMYVEKRQRVA